MREFVNVFVPNTLCSKHAGGSLPRIAGVPMEFHLSFQFLTVQSGSRMGKRPVTTHFCRMANSPDVLITRLSPRDATAKVIRGFMKILIHDLRIRLRRRGKKKEGLFIGMQY
jgi:hypothetical protein